MEQSPVATSFRSVWATLDQAKCKAIRVRENLNYLVDGTAKPDPETPKNAEDPIPSINTLQNWADSLDHALTSCEELLAQLRGNS